MPKLPSIKDLATKWPPDDTLKIPKYTNLEQSVIDMFTRTGERMVTQGNIHEAIRLLPGYELTMIQHFFPSVYDHENTFQNVGAFWVVRFMGCKPITIKYKKRIKYIAYLLAYQNQNLHMVTQYEHINHVELKEDDEELKEDDQEVFLLKQPDTKYGAPGEKKTDDMPKNLKDENVYRDRKPKDLLVRERPGVRKYIEEGYERYQKSKVSKEWEQIIDSVKTYCYIRESKDKELIINWIASKKDYIARTENKVRKNIANAKEDIKKEMPELYEHLTATKDRIQTENGYCSYNIDPERNIKWDVKPD